MSYGSEETTLSFEGLHVACLSGDNGNGKTALLDAMTWALWGKTRASGSRGASDDDLIRLGSAEMEVQFDFELNTQRYKVVKRRRKGKTSVSDWQLTQQDIAGKFVAIGGNTQRETGRHLVQLLSMEFDTFINSAYLQQGRADEFTRQTPDNRKRILAEILGLDRYDRLEEMAKEHYKLRKEAADEMEGQIRLLDAQITEQPVYEQNLKETQDKLSNAISSRHELDIQVAVLRERKTEMDIFAQSLASSQSALRRMISDIEQRQREMANAETTLSELKAIRDQRASILTDYDQLNSARRDREALDPVMDDYNKLALELQTTIAFIEKEEIQLKSELTRLEYQIKQVELQEAELITLDSRLNELKSLLKRESEASEIHGAAEEHLRLKQEHFAELKARHDQVKQELAEVEEMIGLLEQPRSSCPVCGSDLDISKRSEVVTRQRIKHGSLKDSLNNLIAEGKASKFAVSEAEIGLRSSVAERDSFIQLHSELTHGETRRMVLLEARNECKQAMKSADIIKDHLRNGSYAGPKMVLRTRQEQELKRLHNGKIQHEQLVLKIKQLEPAEQRYIRLQQADGAWEQGSADCQRLAKLLDERTKEADAEKARLASLELNLKDYDKVRTELTVAESDLGRLQNEINILKVIEGGLEKDVASCIRAEGERRLLAERLKHTDNERKIYQALAASFGKRGVQALIIENAIPEIEEEANTLLARMTDNSMQVAFETTRAARSKGAEIETLDIRITDEAGTRPYELFSGGEGFRVNFAIRIALSRLLARRSGAKLQTLILDEGFGSQDGKGREKLVEVIDTIKDDFEKILVITHFEEMKDSFAQRIEVVKGPSGSTIQIL